MDIERFFKYFFLTINKYFRLLVMKKEKENIPK